MFCRPPLTVAFLKGTTMGSRNVSILSISQAIGISGLGVVVLLGGIIGSELSPSPAWTTLPVSIMVVGMALSTIPAARLMARIGRRRGFVAGAAAAGLAALLAACAVAWGSFLLFCTATLLIGANGAFVQQYRFAAAESAGPPHAARAVSWRDTLARNSPRAPRIGWRQGRTPGPLSASRSCMRSPWQCCCG